MYQKHEKYQPIPNHLTLICRLHKAKDFGEALHLNPFYKGVPKLLFFHCCRGNTPNYGVRVGAQTGAGAVAGAGAGTGAGLNSTTGLRKDNIE
jgi:hypothetical protein